jgi:hypothetical protein
MEQYTNGRKGRPLINSGISTAFDEERALLGMMVFSPVPF